MSPASIFLKKACHVHCLLDISALMTTHTGGQMRDNWLPGVDSPAQEVQAFRCQKVRTTKLLQISRLILSGFIVRPKVVFTDEQGGRFASANALGR